MTDPHPLRRLLLLAPAALALAIPAYATWSICATDSATGEVVVATATCIPGEDLKEIVPVIVVEYGAGASQSFVNYWARVRMWDELRLGRVPQTILDDINEDDIGATLRQYGLVDLQGRAATYTGSSAGHWRGGVTGQVGTITYAIQGNVLTGQPVVAMAEAALVNTPGDLGQRVMAAMEAARSMGGDGRCSCDAMHPPSCGSPPPVFTKSAHVAHLTLARPGDADGDCNVQIGCANGDYYLHLNVIGAINDPDPVVVLQGMYDQWRLDQAGRPDAVHSQVLPREAAAAAGSPDAVAFVLDLADLENQPLASGGCTISVQHDARSAGLSTLHAVHDHGDGTYTVEMTPGASPGLDRLRFVVDDGVRSVTLWPPATLLHEPAPPAPVNDLEPVPGLDSPALDRGARLLPDGLTAWLLSTRNGWPRQVLRATRAGTSDPFGAAVSVANLNQPEGRYTGLWVSADELRVYLSGFAEGSAVEQLFSSERASTADPFPKPRLIAGLDSGAGDGALWLAPDELEMLFHSARPGGAGAGGGGGLDLWRTRRFSLEAEWLPPEPLSALNTASDETAPMRVENGTRLLFSRDGEPCFAELDPADAFLADAPLPGSVHPDSAQLTATAEEGGGEWLWLSREGAGTAGDVARARRTLTALSASAATLSVSAGGNLDFQLDAGPARAGASYALVLGASGATPGARALDAVLPLARDGLTRYSRAHANQPPLRRFAGALDAAGRADARLHLPAGAPVPPAFVGRSLLAAFVAVQGGSAYASNSVEFELIP